MKKMLTFAIIALLLGSCRTWDYGDTYVQTVEKGDFSPKLEWVVIDGTKVWGGNCTITYTASKMVDSVDNFGYWSKLGGLMPDVGSNYIEGLHQSARAAWRVDPEDPNYIYLGYIVYVKGESEPQRGYLKDYNGEKFRVQVGIPFFAHVKNHGEWWGVSVSHGGRSGYVKVIDKALKREKFMVVMNLYYGGTVPAPTDVTLTMEAIDTHWNYDN
jgi:hypothetical protein